MKYRVYAATAACLMLAGCGTAAEPGTPENVTTSDTAAAASETTSGTTDTAETAETTAENTTTAAESASETEQTAKPAETTAEPEKAAYTWYKEPYLNAEDVNVCGEFEMLANYGWYLDTGCMVVRQNGQIGLIDFDGNELVPVKYDSLYGELDTAEAHYSFTSNTTHESVCYCLKTNSLIQEENRECPACGTMFSTCACGEGYVFDANSSTTGRYDIYSVHSGAAGDNVSVLCQIPYEANVNPAGAVTARKVLIDTPDETGVTGKLDSGIGIVSQNQIVTDFIYDNGTDFKDGVAAFCKDGKWGYLNQSGNTVIPFEYDGALYESNVMLGSDSDTGAHSRIAYLPSGGYIALNRADGAGFADTAGNMAVPVGEFAAARPVHNGMAWVKDADTGLWGVIRL